MEIWDIYNADRQKTGKTMVRGAAFESGAYHLAVHVCVFGSDGRMLIQQRQSDKKDWPDLWDISVGGSAIAGENAAEAAERELYEELGIRVDLTGIRPNLTFNFSNGFDNFFLIEKDVAISEPVLQAEEVKDAKWATRDEIKQMMTDGIFVPYHPSLIDLLFEARMRFGAHCR